jgi:polysaccharide pyruvyl transferase WcaK-like protein
MHAAILAAGMGVPAIGVAYNQKFSGFFSLIGREDAVISLDHLVASNDIEPLVLRMSQMLQTRDNVASSISDLRNTLVKFNESLFNGQ